MSYDASILIAPSSSITLADAERVLREFFQDYDEPVTIELLDQKILLTITEWECRIYYDDGPHVIGESEDMAEWSAADRPDKDIIRTCRRRFDLSGDPDPNVDYFNEFLFIMEQIGALPGTFVWDQADGKFFLPRVDNE